MKYPAMREVLYGILIQHSKKKEKGKKRPMYKTGESQKQKTFQRNTYNIYLMFKACKIICRLWGCVTKDYMSGHGKHQILRRNFLGEKS